MTRLRSLLLLIVAMLLLTMSACSWSASTDSESRDTVGTVGSAGSAQASTSAEVAEPRNWTRLAALSATESTRSEPFELTGPKVRVSYEIRGSGDFSASIYVVPEGVEAEKSGEVPIVIRQDQTDKTYLERKPGRYRLEVVSVRSNFSVTVEEAK